MPNAIDKVPVIQAELDKVAVGELTSGWMELNDELVKYSGGNEVKIPEMIMDGLADYDRAKGFVEGSIEVKWKTYEMSQDRGRSFSFDENDVDETNFILTASRVTGEFQRVHVIPEIDAYRYSKIAALAKEANRFRAGYTPSADDILTQLYADLGEVTDLYGEENVIITMNSKVARILDLSKELSKSISAGEFKQGNVSLKIKMLDETYPIIRVPSARMKSEYEFLTGKSGKEKGGFAPTSGAKDINWIISAKRSPIAVSKTDEMRAFDPKTNQLARAWKLDYRKFHELWVPKNKLDGIFVNLKQS